MLRRRLFSYVILGAICLGIAPTRSRAEDIVTTLTKVADLPLSGSGSTLPEMEGHSPRLPRGGLLQIGNELWFTTREGGEFTDPGAIVSFNLGTNTFTTQHSFGLSDPALPETARWDGFNPGKTTLVQGPDGTIYYAAAFGGAMTNDYSATNGGAIGAFNPGTVRTEGVSVLWNGAVLANQPRNLTYSTPIYVPTATGASIYFNTYAGGTSDWGTVQKLTLDLNGTVTNTTQITELTGPNGRQTQGGLLQVGTKIYFATATTAGGALPTLQSIDTENNDAISLLSTTWTTGGVTGGWSKPIYDAERDAIYSVSLGSTNVAQGGILKWDIQTSQQSILLNSRDGSGGNFADPILLGDSLYYIKQSSGSGANSGGQLWRYDLDDSSLSLLYNLNDYFGKASGQSGTLSKVVENGVESLYFLTAEDTSGANLGALYKLEITQVPEPGSIALLLLGGLGFGLVRMRRGNAPSTR